MDIDFHYYATYVAAVVAGYGTAEATSIAHAAQYIDDATPIRQIETTEIETIATVLPTISSDPHEETAVGSANDWNPTKIARHRRMWTAFHFLPGNIAAPRHPVPYSGPQSDSSVYGTWHYNDELAQLEFQSMCVPGSPLAVAMVEDTRQHHRHDLKMIGIRMHVLIDTFAHQHFCGSAAWHVNDVHNDGQYYDEDGEIWNIEVGWFEKTGGSGNYNSLGFTGHGRMGHLPDYPWITFLYQPRWSDKTLTRDNPVQYSRAFREMAHALYCIRAGTEYRYGLDDSALLSTLGVSAAVFATVDEIIRLRPKGERMAESRAYILADWTDERCEHWRERLDGKHFEHAGLKSAPQAYREEQYQQDAEALLGKGQSIGGSDYAAWHAAALRHLTFVETYLGEHKLEDNQFGDTTKLQVWEPDPNNPHVNDWLIQAV